jgi:predicted ATPase/DNA-binding CsgD family transcriptional regulator/DNA-binding XRE family transcriptional regulator
MAVAASRDPFAVRLRRHREAAGLTQEELAERAGLTAKGISALERAERRRPYPQTVRALASALALSDEERADLIASVPRPGDPDGPGAHGAPAPGGTSLPMPPTPMLGRGEELALVIEQIRAPEVRLLTITGPGGVGKTRLAVEAARSVAADEPFAGLTWFCDLSAVRSSGDVLQAIARALPTAFPSSGEPSEAIVRFLGERPCLLLLDNLEHLLDAAPGIGRLLASTRLTILATSREPLRLRWERLLPLQPLSLPDLRHLPAPGALAAVPSVALFVDRAGAGSSPFVLDASNAAAVAKLCARLDGLPLAIELVAARAAQLGAQSALERLDRHLPIGEVPLRDAPERHRSLRATFEWSLDLLPDDHRALFARLGAFEGGWTVEAAEAVAPAGLADVLEALWSLADRSLLVVTAADDAGEARFGMLDTAREVAREHLRAAGGDEVATAHARYCAGLAERLAGELKGPSQASAAVQLEREEANFRAALSWAAGHVGDEAYEIGLRLSGSLGWFWFLHGYPPEARAWFEALLETPAADSGPKTAVLRARALNAAGFRATDQGEYELAARAHGDALATWRATGDVPGLVASLHGVGDTALWLGRPVEALAAYEQGLALATGRGTAEDVALFEFHLGQLGWLTGRLRDAEQHAQTALDVATASGSTTWPPYALFILASVAHETGMVRRAGERYRRALQLAWEHRDRLCVRMALPGLAALAALEGDPVRAVRLTAAAGSLESSAGIWAFPPIRERHERWFRAAVERMDEATQRDAWAEGASMSIDEVIDEALALPKLPRDAALVTTARIRLSVREREVLDLVAAGHSNRAIAEVLVVTPHTAKYHVTSLLNKLGAANRAEAVARAAGLGLIAIAPN